MRICCVDFCSVFCLDAQHEPDCTGDIRKGGSDDAIRHQSCVTRSTSTRAPRHREAAEGGRFCLAKHKVRSAMARHPLLEPAERGLIMRLGKGIVCVLVWLLAAALFVPQFTPAQSVPPDRWTQKDLKVAITGAKTADDHARIAQYYRLEAIRFESEARKQAAFAERYTTRTGRHCRWLASEYAKKAQKARAIASLHDNLAKTARKQSL
jgi:hypothetical protein